MKTPAYLQQFINKAALPLWKSNLWLRSLGSDSCQIELRPFLGEQVSASLKPPPPLALIAIPVGTLRKETGVCLGHGDQLPRSLLKGAPLPLVLLRQGESPDPVARVVCGGWTSLPGDLGREHQEKVTGMGW